MTSLVSGPLPLPKTPPLPIVVHAGERVLTPEQYEELRRGGDSR